MLNGWGAFSTGISLCSFGIFGCILGSISMIAGAATMALGANEIVAGISGTNLLQSWTGISSSTYNAIYAGFNIASGITTIAGRLGMRMVGDTFSNKATIKYQPYGKISTKNNIYFYNGKGDPYWSIHNFNSAINNTPSGYHWHTSLGRDESHIYNYLEFLFKFIIRKC